MKNIVKMAMLLSAVSAAQLHSDVTYAYEVKGDKQVVSSVFCNGNSDECIKACADCGGTIVSGITAGQDGVFAVKCQNTTKCSKPK